MYVVITANKYATKQKEVATIVNVISPLIIESTASNSMADVLNFQTGLRVEETCSNCGVPQIRINGLEGQYTSGYGSSGRSASSALPAIR